MNVLSLPSLEIKFDRELPREIVLMLLGGRKTSRGWLSRLDFYQSCWAIDSGVELSRELGTAPDRLIGDGDSASAEAWAWAAARGAKVFSYGSEKDLTDFQLALELLALECATAPKGVFLTGCFGGRFDHLISVLNSFAGWSDKYIPIAMADEREALFLLRGPAAAQVKFHRQPAVVSLIPFEESRGVSIGGVRWPLQGVVLEHGRPYSISNRPDGGELTASVERGLVGLYFCWNEIAE